MCVWTKTLIDELCGSLANFCFNYKTKCGETLPVDPLSSVEIMTGKMQTSKFLLQQKMMRTQNRGEYFWGPMSCSLTKGSFYFETSGSTSRCQWETLFAWEVVEDWFEIICFWGGQSSITKFTLPIPSHRIPPNHLSLSLSLSCLFVS